jgi:hypothetical protein
MTLQFHLLTVQVASVSARCWATQDLPLKHGKDEPRKRTTAQWEMEIGKQQTEAPLRVQVHCLFFLLGQNR